MNKSGLRWCMLFLAAILVMPGCRKKEEPYFYESSRRSSDAPVKEVPKDILSTQQAFINVAKQVNPAVVNISTVSRKKAVRPMFEFSPFFDDFFGGESPVPQYRRDKSLGSGFIINKEGYIVTNDHVVKDAETIQVKLSDDRTYNARVVGRDPKTDLAVLKISAKGDLPAAVLGDSEKLQVGQWAIAIGNPFGLDKTVTIGVISATGRANMGIETYEDFIQTDASINPGNSGGPLLNVYGEVIGINTAIVAAGQGIGFAIPVNMAKQVIGQLMKKGSVTRGWLGVSIQQVTEPLAESLGMKKATGALIADVMTNSPAAKAGLRQGDVILRLDGKEIRDARHLQMAVADIQAGKKVEVEVLREGKTLKTSVTVSSLDSPDAAQSKAESAPMETLGITVAELPREYRQRGLTGVVVTVVEPDSVAGEGGLERGDVVQAINGKRVNSIAEYTKALRDAQKRGVASFLVRRGDASLYFAFKY